jgi:hypothetical protein
LDFSSSSFYRPRRRPRPSSLVLCPASNLQNTVLFKVSGVGCQHFGRWLLASGCLIVARGLTLRMKLRLAGTVNRLNVEHRTSNIDDATLYRF